MNILNIAEDTSLLSVNVENILFESMWEIPNGVSLNSYIIKGEKTAIVDGVCGWDGVPESLYTLLDKLDVALESISYLIVNHVEPDHSGWIEKFKRINPNFKIVCSKKGKELIEAFFAPDVEIICVTDGDTLDLGNGHILTFAEIPNVHWPDTIATFDTLTGVLFSCDAFGSFGKVNSTFYMDDLSEKELVQYEGDMVRYYSNIVAMFSPQVKKAIAKCQTLPIKIIAPGHGLLCREPDRVMAAYMNYANYQSGITRKEVTLIWGSMYGMTEKAVQYILPILEKEDVIVHVHKVPETDWGTILSSAWISSGIILAMPTYEFKMFPAMAAVLEELGKKKVLNRKAFRFGSFGWSGGAQKELDEILTRYNMNWEFVEPVEFKGAPRDEHLQEIAHRVKLLLTDINALGE